MTQEMGLETFHFRCQVADTRGRALSVGRQCGTLAKHTYIL